MNLSKWAQKLLSFWWLFALFLLLTIPAGQLYLRYATPLYMSQAKLLIKGVGAGSNLSEISILSEGLGIETGMKDMTNEIEILRSRPIVSRVVERLGIQTTYFRQGAIRNTELYVDSPILVESFELSGKRDRLSFFIEMGYYQDFRFKMKEDGEGEKHIFGQPFENEYGKFLISQSKTATLHPGLYRVQISPVESVANYYKRAIQIDVVGSQRGSGILQLKLIDPTPKKATDILNTLIQVYNEAEIFENTQVLKNTADFVEERIAQLTVELDSIETGIEEFKSENDIITDKAASSLDFTLVELRSTIEKLSGLEIEMQLLSALERELLENPDKLIPVNIVGAAPSLSELIMQYNDTYLQRKKLLETVSDENPQIQLMNDEMTELRGLIAVSIKNLKSNLEIPLGRARNEIAELRGGLSNVPTVEKQLLDRLRMQSIKENLFLFLLQKKEETQLSRAISTANTRVIEGARNSGGAISPNRKFIRLGSILAGLLLPLMILGINEILATTVDSEDAIKALTSVPIVGRIAHYKPNEEILIKPNDRSIKAEMFRLLRTNLSYTNAGKSNQQQTLLVTSSTTGEGKTITSINLAITIALAGKKVVLVDLDLRKPKLSNYLGVPGETGVTNYLIGNASFEDILNADEQRPNFHYITSGPVPPNPAELILSDQTTELINTLKAQFDYVILDCPPIGVVADGLLLRQHITHMLYLVRHKKTKKDSLRYMEEQYQQGELVSPLIVINDIKSGYNSKAYGGYHQAYGSGYYLNSK